LKTLLGIAAGFQRFGSCVEGYSVASSCGLNEDT
jgi:hypothetical protein